jgi:hypothetical protein
MPFQQVKWDVEVIKDSSILWWSLLGASRRFGGKTSEKMAQCDPCGAEI